MPRPTLCYFNANLEGKLPHRMMTKPGKVGIDAKYGKSGQVYVVVSLGACPHRFYLWSTFAADTGKGWQLCPPVELKKSVLGPLLGEDYTSRRCVAITDVEASKLLARQALVNRPPGKPEAMWETYTALLKSLSNARIEQQVKAVLKGVPRPRCKPVRRPPLGKLTQSTLESNRALSVRQPHAEAILRGIKRIEYRSFPTGIRGRVYIYASLKLDDDLPSGYDFPSEGLPRGYVVGSVEITDCTGKEGLYRWHLAKPERLAEPRKPTRQPQPSFFFAW
ncbi:MAG: ASCH domain-containing protein [Gemmatales bacterium]